MKNEFDLKISLKEFEELINREKGMYDFNQAMRMWNESEFVNSATKEMADFRLWQIELAARFDEHRFNPKWHDPKTIERIKN